MGLREDLLSINDELIKAKGEIVAKIGDLETAVANAGQVTPEVQEALDAVKASAQALDDVVPDQVSEPPVEEPPVEPTPAEPSPGEPEA